MHLHKALALAPVAFLTSPVAALNIAYCSTQNTGSAYAVVNSVYNSNGLCHDQCSDSHAFAVVQGQSCWCSNYIPQAQQDSSKCNVGCPGFPDDKCGNPADNLYGYIALTMSASGTQAVSTSASSTSTSSSSSQTSTDTTSQTVTRSVSSTKAPTSTTPTSTSSSALSSSSSSSFTPTPTTGIQTLTVSGNVVTQTVTGMSTPAAALTSKKKASGGVIAGAVLGTMLGAALIGGFVFFCLRRLHNKRKSDDLSPSTPQRTTSTMSRNELLNESRKTPVLQTETMRHSFLGGETESPMSSTSDRRNSRLMVCDQRLNPMAMHDNGSRTSVFTVEDNKDYGRKLNVRNPDSGPAR